VISFEDIKRDPLITALRLLKYLELERPQDEIVEAVNASEFAKAQKAEQSFLKEQINDGQFHQVNRKGRPGEWREVFSPACLTEFRGFPNYVLKQLGYEIPESEIKFQQAFKHSEQNIYQWDRDITQGTAREWCGATGKVIATLRNAHTIDEIEAVGRVAVALDWISVLFEKPAPNISRTQKLFISFKSACDAMRDNSLLKLQVARSLARIGAPEHAMRILDREIAKQLPCMYDSESIRLTRLIVGKEYLNKGDIFRAILIMKYGGLKYIWRLSRNKFGKNRESNAR
jgi:hypothetical protein